MVLVFASNNAHKLEEVRRIMPNGIKVLSLHDIGFEQEIEETGTTLAENSKIKAATIADYIRSQKSEVRSQIDGVFADDTGLEIEALSGEPGVYTARWYMRPTPSLPEGKEPLTEQEIYHANRAKALRELADKENRNAQFKTVITIIMMNGARLKANGEEMIQVEGIVRGRIAMEEFGEGGFGYDSVFIPEGYDKTFGELPAELKNRISHRARALEALIKVLNK